MHVTCDHPVLPAPLSASASGQFIQGLPEIAAGFWDYIRRGRVCLDAYVRNLSSGNHAAERLENALHNVQRLEN